MNTNKYLNLLKIIIKPHQRMNITLDLIKIQQNNLPNTRLRLTNRTKAEINWEMDSSNTRLKIFMLARFK